jgi:hypothetical protein
MHIFAKSALVQSAWQRCSWEFKLAMVDIAQRVQLPSGLNSDVV